MENRYYTPDVSEFHVGFEYKYLAPSEQWISFRCYDETPEGKLDWRALRSKDMKDVRVKYLDKQDIEELGFEHTGGSMIKNTLDEFTIDYNDPRGTYNKVIILYNYSSKWCLIVQGNYETPYPDWPTRFTGYVKNKSELKKILKMLDISHE